jgi:N-acetylmuramoyl-L-alanine amidase
MTKVYVDAGHGGTDPGAIGIAKIEEEDITLSVAKYLEAELKRQGISVKMSRTGDTLKSVNVRAKESNNWGADIFCSIHCNSYKEEGANGTETLIYAKGGKAEKIAKKVQSNLVSVLKTNDRGIKVRPDLCVLRDTKAPAFLSEIAFISNKEDKAKVDEATEQKACAIAICKGICSYLGISYKGEVKVATTVKKDYVGHWAEKAIDYCVEKKYMVGDGKGKFRPNDTLTRAELAQVLYNIDHQAKK